MKDIMRTHPYWIPLAMAATLMGKLAASAQDWQTVDDFGLAGGDAEAHGVAVDAAGRIYVVGTANGHAIVRYSATAARIGARGMILFTRRKRIPNRERTICSTPSRSRLKATCLSAVQVRHGPED